MLKDFQARLQALLTPPMPVETKPPVATGTDNGTGTQTGTTTDGGQNGSGQDTTPQNAFE